MSVGNAGNVPVFGRNVQVPFGAGAPRSEAPRTGINDLVGSSVEAHPTFDRGALLRLGAGSPQAECQLGSTGVIGIGGRPAEVSDWYARGEASDGAMQPRLECRPATLSSMQAFLESDGAGEVRPGCVGVADAAHDVHAWHMGGKSDGEIAGPYNFGEGRITLDRDF